MRIIISSTPITDINKRRTIDKEKLKKKYLKESKRRAVIERSFSWLHKYPKLDRFIEKTIKSYAGLLLLGSSMIVAGKVS